MVKQSRDDPFVIKQNKSLSEYDVHRKLDAAEGISWLEVVDITTYDFPYINHLLQLAYHDWSSEMPSLPEPYHAEWLITDHKGEVINQEQQLSWPANEGERSFLTEAVESCLLEGEISVVEGSHAEVCIATPILTRESRETFAVLVCVISGVDDSVLSFAKFMISSAANSFRTSFYKRFETIFVTDLLEMGKQAEREEQRRSILFRVVQSLHDKIDVDSVLTEVFDIIAGLYPEAQIQLLMSQDHHSRDPRVKSLQLHGQDHLCVRAFMEGRMLRLDTVSIHKEPSIEMAVPLIGKQGVYGVFHLIMKSTEIEEVDLELVSMLAGTAGSAFENAKLYEQSNLLVTELRLINELTKRLNQSLRLKEVFKFATEELLTIFKAEYCCITQIDKESSHFEIMSCNVPAMSKEYYPKDYGFSGLVYSTREPIILSDYKAYGKVTSQLMELTDSRSLIVAPLIVRGEVNGSIMLAHRNESFFSYENYKLLQILSPHIGLAIANASLHAEVRRMANRDMLTELYARHYLDDSIQEFQKKDEGGALIIVDIDKFKQINDTFGHQTGDKILKQVCSIIKTSVRKTDVAARWGGEELAVYLPGANVHSGYQLAEIIRLRVAMETNPSVTVSCGIAEWNRASEKISVESLFYSADMALYKAKNNGRNQAQISLSS
ncbi:diguanylate cyclase (GGDEF)-like protein [Fontibacillus solani]|uniref:Diguanylate cyclase (GGDEF)-like protein n=1 Tax=Fontibacillus solani TaxID=1572857 RepID=A0A7W3XSY2_9BACL|nr:sensor domain-containing diguanylate cyclase [Fontibacillus solani]MBA9087020.1 diguanylate cyclase (GGDEF)-like protein [Fontibacillus solani]